MVIKVFSFTAVSYAFAAISRGAYGNETVPGSRPYADGVELTALADKYLQSWTYWQYKGYIYKHWEPHW